MKRAVLCVAILACSLAWLAPEASADHRYRSRRHYYGHRDRGYHLSVQLGGYGGGYGYSRYYSPYYRSHSYYSPYSRYSYSRSYYGGYYGYPSHYSYGYGGGYCW